MDEQNQPAHNIEVRHLLNAQENKINLLTKQLTIAEAVIAAKDEEIKLLTQEKIDAARSIKSD